MGGVLAMIGVIACPITSGDTAFRSARLTIADWFRISQKQSRNRLILAAPLLIAGYLISRIDYQVVWRYFSWSNQTLAMIALWAGAVYLAVKVSPISSLMAAIPAAFMSAVCCTYLIYAEEGFHLSASIAYPAGIIFAVLCIIVFIWKAYLPGMKKDRRL